MAETQTQTAPAGSADGSSPSATANAGSTNPQPAGAGQVVPDYGGGNGNSDPSDGGDGADGGDSGRQRSGKAERRIGELTARIRELEAQKAKDSDVITQLLASNHAAPNLPDYSGEDEVPVAKVAKDVYEAVSKELDAKLAGSLGVIDNKNKITASARQNIVEAQQARRDYSVLDESSENFDPDLASEIDDGFIRMFNIDPSYSYADHLKTYKSVLGSRARSTTGTTGSPQAVRQQAQPKRSQEFNQNMTTDEMKAWFAARRAS